MNETKPSFNIGFILAKWDESLGPVIISVYPENFIKDPDLFAVQCFSQSQFIFGGEEFVKISFVMPLVHLQSDAMLFFDYIPDKAVRGGRHPILLILMYEEKIPRSIINRYKGKINDKLENIKAHFIDSSYIQNAIKEIHQTIIASLSEMHPEAFEALKDSENRFQSLFESARDAIFIFESDSNIIIEANLQAQVLINKPRNKILGMKTKELFLPDDVDKFKIHIREHLRDKNAPPIVTNVITSDRKKVPVEITASIIDVGKAHLIQATFRDITKREEAEILAKRMKLYAESIVETIRQPVIVLDSEFRILSANFSFLETFRHVPQDIENKSIFKIGRGQWDIPEVKSLLNDMLKVQNQIDEYEINHTFSGGVGPKRLLIDASRMENEEDQTEIIILVMEDITHRK